MDPTETRKVTVLRRNGSLVIECSMESFTFYDQRALSIILPCMPEEGKSLTFEITKVG